MCRSCLAVTYHPLCPGLPQIRAKTGQNVARTQRRNNRVLKLGDGRHRFRQAVEGNVRIQVVYVVVTDIGKLLSFRWAWSYSPGRSYFRDQPCHEARNSDIIHYPDTVATVKIGIVCDNSNILKGSVHDARLIGDSATHALRFSRESHPKT